MKRAQLAYAAAGLAESACTFLDNHTPAWPWIAGRVRCPNGPLARLAFWLYENADRDWADEATWDHAVANVERIGTRVETTGPGEWVCCGTRIWCGGLVHRPTCWRCKQPMQPVEANR